MSDKEITVEGEKKKLDRPGGNNSRLYDRNRYLYRLGCVEYLSAPTSPRSRVCSVVHYRISRGAVPWWTKIEAGSKKVKSNLCKIVYNFQ